MITQIQSTLPNSFHSYRFHCNATFSADQTLNVHIFTPHMLSAISSFSVLLISAHCSNFRKFQCNIGHSTQLLTSLPTAVTKLRLDARYHRLCVFHFVRSALSAHRYVTDTVVLVYPLSLHAFQTFPCMKRATGLSKIHGSAMNIRTYPLSNKGCLTIQSLGIITMYHGQPLCPSSLLFSKVVVRTAYQPSSPCHTACTDQSIQQFDLL
jgi:hypothetical protein